MLLDQSNGARRPNAADSIAVITPKEYAQIDELGGLAWYGMVLSGMVLKNTNLNEQISLE